MNMKKTLALLALIFICNISFAQNKWFSLYADSSALVKDADEITRQFISDLERVVQLDIKVEKHTTPYLIYNDKNIIHLPFWNEVIQPQKQFFAEVAGGEKEGKEVFGLFFNGFYLAHEAGHILAAATGKKYDNAYSSEYDANALSILFWKKNGQQKNLEKCYQYAKQMLKTLKNPVPEGEDYESYITTHYNELASDPYKYGYIQFSQLAEIYENKTLPDFDTFVKNGMSIK